MKTIKVNSYCGLVKAMKTRWFVRHQIIKKQIFVSLRSPA